MRAKSKYYTQRLNQTYAIILSCELREHPIQIHDIPDGDCVGDVIGTRVGSGVGIGVGIEVGLGVGIGVGSGVGRGVGIDIGELYSV